MKGSKRKKAKGAAGAKSSAKVFSKADTSFNFGANVKPRRTGKAGGGSV